jgi:hypothetical protein
MVVKAEWYYSESGNERYDPATEMAEYKSGDTWYPDTCYSTNPAYVEYNSGTCDYSSSTQVYGYQVYGSALNGGRRRIKLITGGVSYELQQEVPGVSPSYNSSDLPEWNYNLFGGISYDDSDFRVNSGQLHVNTRITTLDMGMTAKKDRLSLTGAFRYEYARGYSNLSGADSDTAGFLFMPGYQILSQDEQFLNLGLYGMLDLAYISRKHADNQTRIMPGVAATASRATPIGLFSLAYSFEYNQNMSGDDEVTGNNHINTQLGAADYILPITKNFYVGGGFLYTYAMDMPSSIDNDFLEAHLTAGAIQLNNWKFMADYYASIDGTGNQGINFVAGYQW